MSVVSRVSVNFCHCGDGAFPETLSARTRRSWPNFAASLLRTQNVIINLFKLKLDEPERQCSSPRQSTRNGNSLFVHARRQRIPVTELSFRLPISTSSLRPLALRTRHSTVRREATATISESNSSALRMKRTRRTKTK